MGELVYHLEGHSLYLDGHLILDLGERSAREAAKLYALLIERQRPALAAALRERLRALRAEVGEAR